MQFTSEIKVELTDAMGDDKRIATAARASTGKGEPKTEEETAGLIRYLMKCRHGGPFECGAMTFKIQAPSFVWWEWVRHRVGFSYSLESGRYKELAPVFWVPRLDRPMIAAPDSKPARPSFVQAGAEIAMRAVSWLEYGYKIAWIVYRSLLLLGVASEVARAVLPFGVYYTGIVTCNPRSLMHFLSLRTRDERAAVKSYPQSEIEEAARQCEEHFAARWPLTYAAFNENGRVAP